MTAWYTLLGVLPAIRRPAASARVLESQLCHEGVQVASGSWPPFVWQKVSGATYRHTHYHCFAAVLLYVDVVRLASGSAEPRIS